MDQEFEQFVRREKIYRRKVLIIGVLLMSLGAFFIYIDWTIMGSIPLILGLLFLIGLLHNGASKEAFLKQKSLEQKKHEEKLKLEKAEKDKKNAAKQLEKQKLQKTEETIKIIDTNLNKLISIDFPKPISFKSNITDNEQTIIEKSGVDVIQKFVRIYTFLNDAHRNLENVRESMREEFDPKQLLEDVKWRIEEEKNPSLDDLSEKLGRLASGDYRDTSADGLLKELLKFSNKLVPVFSKEIAQVAYLEAMANSMLIFLLNNKQILFYEILEVFDKIGALDSSWQKMISYKMDNIENKLDLLNGSLLDLNDKLDGLLDKNEAIINSLDSVDSSIKSNNLLQAITAYQTYRINKKTKRLD